MQDEF